MISPSGSVFYQDEYQTFYDVQWETINGLLDITTTIKQPFVWGEESEAFIKNGTLFKKGIITVERQILRIYGGGYEIVASGASQILDFIQMNFPCGGGPVDNFKYHFNCSVLDETIIKVSDGSHWVDITETDHVSSIWGNVNLDGSVVNPNPTDASALEWIDVWA